MSKRPVGSVTAKGDGEIVEIGGSEEAEVAAWWDSLTAHEQSSIGRKCGADFERLGKWDQLMPIGQQMRIHMYYDAVKAEKGHV